MKDYILIKVGVGLEDPVLQEVLKLSKTDEAQKVFGQYDIAA